MLELSHITKTFPGVRALDDVSLTFRPGEIHGLVGENGAGKSTAIKIVSGIYQSDAGEMRLNGQPHVVHSVRDALHKGIGIVPQELQIIPDISVAENIMIEKLEALGRFGIVDWKRVFAEATQWMQRVGLNVSPEMLVHRLSAAQKQLVQIAKALASEVTVLLLDEPTSSLTEHETRQLFTLLRKLRERGVTLIFVSHKFDELFALCDCVSVLRDGRFVGSRPIRELTPPELVQMMLGRHCNTEHVGPLSPDRTKEMLRAEGVTRVGKANDVGFTLWQGEVLGFYGLVGSGRTELARLLIGEDQMDRGEVYVAGERARIGSVRESVNRYGLGYVTENRKEDGLLLDDPVLTNITITVWEQLRGRLTRCIDGQQERGIARQLVDALQIKTPSLEQTTKNLSGGNQQKVSIAKWLAARCQVLIIDEPTVGVDVGAKEQIHQLIWNLAAKEGKAIIVISSDLPELVRLTNRILVFRDQRIVGEIADIDTQRKTYQQVSAEIGPLLA
jgi:ribose transport system ATP-binding protein